MTLGALCSNQTAGQRLGAGGSDRSVTSSEEPPAAGAKRGLGGAAGTGPRSGSSRLETDNDKEDMSLLNYV